MITPSSALLHQYNRQVFLNQQILQGQLERAQIAQAVIEGVRERYFKKLRKKLRGKKLRGKKLRLRRRLVGAGHRAGPDTGLGVGAGHCAGPDITPIYFHNSLHSPLAKKIRLG